MHGALLVPNRDRFDASSAMNRVVNGDVMYANDAENGVYAQRKQRLVDRVTAGPFSHEYASQVSEWNVRGRYRPAANGVNRGPV
jgi:hypothetical protein